VAISMIKRVKNNIFLQQVCNSVHPVCWIKTKWNPWSRGLKIFFLQEKVLDFPKLGVLLKISNAGPLKFLWARLQLNP